MNKRLLLILIMFPVIATLIILAVTKEPALQNKFTVGIINPNPGTKTIQDVFIRELSNQTKKEGWDLTFLRCENKKTLDADLRNLAAQHPDIIFTVTTPATIKAEKIFSGENVPGIFVLYDPVQTGIINSLSNPGGNFTGIQVRGSVPKVLDWLVSVSPEIKNIFVPIKFDTESATMSIQDLEKAAQSLGVELTVAEVNNMEELNGALNSIPEGTDAIFLLNSIFISTNAKRIIDAAIRRKLPTAASIGKDKEGVLLTYSSPHEVSGKQASILAHLVLHGQPPAEIPTEIADFYFSVNLNTAEKIGLKLPENILAQADKLIY